MDKKKAVIMDGNEAAAYVSYAFTEVAGIFPITPSAMGPFQEQFERNQRNLLAFLQEQITESGGSV